MAVVTIDGDALRVELTVPERVRSLRADEIRVPLAVITEVRYVADVLAQVRGERQPGARVPGLSALGTWQGVVGNVAFRDFVVVERPGPGVVIEGSDEFDRLVLGTHDPAALIAELEARLRASDGRRPNG